MPRSRTNQPRRGFLRIVAAAPVAVFLGVRPAPAADEPRLDPNSERAKQLSYVHNADAADNPGRKKGARCATCTHFHGTDGAQWSSCNIFPDHLVNAGGWCTAWLGAQ